MSYVNTVLNALTFAAIPAMKDAARPVIATPSMPLGSTSRISSLIASLNWTSVWARGFAASDALAAASSGDSTAAIMPGITITSGRSIFGYAPISGVRLAADMLLADSPRWTSAKFVVQYPKDSTNPSPNTMPSTDSVASPMPVRLVPGHELSSWVRSAILATSPSQPPTRCSPTTVNGTSIATITKNWSTSL